jgi:hypothetical protein
MAAPDYEAKSDATAGEWKALLAPMLASAASAEEIGGYIVIAVNTQNTVELRTNLGDNSLRRVLRMVMPGVPDA